MATPVFPTAKQLLCIHSRPPWLVGNHRPLLPGEDPGKVSGLSAMMKWQEEAWNKMRRTLRSEGTLHTLRAHQDASWGPTTTPAADAWAESSWRPPWGGAAAGCKQCYRGLQGNNSACPSSQHIENTLSILSNIKLIFDLIRTNAVAWPSCCHPGS